MTWLDLTWLDLWQEFGGPQLLFVNPIFLNPTQLSKLKSDVMTLQAGRCLVPEIVKVGVLKYPDSLLWSIGIAQIYFFQKASRDSTPAVARFIDFLSKTSLCLEVIPDISTQARVCYWHSWARTEGGIPALIVGFLSPYPCDTRIRRHEGYKPQAESSPFRPTPTVPYCVHQAFCIEVEKINNIKR